MPKRSWDDLFAEVKASKVPKLNKRFERVQTNAVCANVLEQHLSNKATGMHAAELEEKYKPMNYVTKAVKAAQKYRQRERTEEYKEDVDDEYLVDSTRWSDHLPLNIYKELMFFISNWMLSRTH